MQARPLISRILDDEGLTDGLTDPEARLLIEWLVDRAERVAEAGASEPTARQEVETLCRRARSIRRFVALWCHRHDHAAATQLAATERLIAPLPPSDCDNPYDVLQRFLEHEDGERPA